MLEPVRYPCTTEKGRIKMAKLHMEWYNPEPDYYDDEEDED